MEKLLYIFSTWLEIEKVHTFQENVRGIVSVALHVPCQGANPLKLQETLVQKTECRATLLLGVM